MLLIDFNWVRAYCAVVALGIPTSAFVAICCFVNNEEETAKKAFGLLVLCIFILAGMP